MESTHECWIPQCKLLRAIHAILRDQEQHPEQRLAGVQAAAKSLGCQMIPLLEAQPAGAERTETLRSGLLQASQAALPQAGLVMMEIKQRRIRPDGIPAACAVGYRGLLHGPPSIGARARAGVADGACWH